MIAEITRFEQENKLQNNSSIQKYNDASMVAEEAMNFAISTIQTIFNTNVNSNSNVNSNGNKGISGIRFVSKQVDIFMVQKCKSLFQYNDCERGISFPCSIVKNNGIRFQSTDEDECETCWVDGDVLKIELGVHIDGYIATLARTIVLVRDQMNPITGSKADVICAAYMASQAVMKLLIPGQKIAKITKCIELIANAYDCVPVTETYSCQMGRFVLEGKKTIPNSNAISNNDEIAANEVYAINIFMVNNSQIASKAISGPSKSATIFQRNVSQRQQLKLKASRSLITRIDKEFPVFPFNLYDVNGDDEKNLKFAISECLKNGLVVAHVPLVEAADRKEAVANEALGNQVAGNETGRIVAQFKFTILVKPDGSNQVVCGSLNPESMPFVKSIYDLEDRKDIQSILI